LRGRHSFGSETTPTLDLDKTLVELVLDRIRVSLYPEKMEDRHNLGEIHVIFSGRWYFFLSAKGASKT
jgi:hypothetical protein